MANNDKTADANYAVDNEAPDTPISVPDTGDTGESGKLKMIVQLVKKCLGVKDIASMRLSLPASLLEPIPNLEYWHYLDRPDLFAAINDEDDEFMRMLAVIRFVFSKDLKFVHGKVCKPYNSVLGEHFQAHWDIIPVSHGSESSDPPIPALYTTPPAAESVIIPIQPESLGPSEAASMKSGKSGKSSKSNSFVSANVTKSPSTAATSLTGTPVEGNLTAQVSSLSLGRSVQDDDSSSSIVDEGNNTTAGRLRVVFLTEQVSHHPPVSAYYASCPAQQIELVGVDQIAARVSGTTLKVVPGNFNKGIYINITGGFGEGERYHITHPMASVNGLLRGSFYVTIGESTIITRTGGKGETGYRAILEYKEQSWLGKASFKVEGVIHTYDEDDKAHEEWTKVKHVPKSRVLAIIDGSWRHVIKWKLADNITLSPTASNPSIPSSRVGSKIDLTKSDDDWYTLLDLSTLKVIPKVVRPLEKQLPTESHKLWERVTTNLLNKQYSEATKAKVEIEQKQRDLAAERKKAGIEFVPKYFEDDWTNGYPTLTKAGRNAIEGELHEPSPYQLVETKQY